MFGTSSSYNNIFGGINESHMRLFGGDRALSTKDIEGAQPRKYTRHVWGGYDANPYNSGPSYDPSKSTIKSPILGDNVQPLNRAIPNSSGLIFRDPIQMSQSSRLAKNSGFTQSAVFERKQAQTSNNFGQDLPEGQYIIERQRVKNINPTSQLKEQNIFSYPSYVNSGSQNLSKPLINTPIKYDKSMEIAKIREKMEKHLEAHNIFQTKLLATNRSPDSFVLSETQQKNQNIGRNLGNVSSDGFQVGGGDSYINQQAIALRNNPIFAQNRNYGPDDVLFSQLKAQQNQNDAIQNTKNHQSLGNNYQQQQQVVQDNNTQPQLQNSSLPPVQQKLEPNLGENQAIPQDIPPYNNIPKENEKNPLIYHLPNTSLNEKNASGALRQPKEKNGRNLLNSSLNDEMLVQNRYSLKPKQSFVKDTSNIAPTSDPIPAQYPKPTPRGQQQFFQSQNQENGQQQPGNEQLVQRNEVRTNLSSRGRMILNQGKLRLTSNGEYGNGTGFLNNTPFLKGKILYQSKRDNYLYSNAPLRSQSAQGNRLQNEINNLKQANPNEILNPSQSTQDLGPKYRLPLKAQYPDYNKNNNSGMLSRNGNITTPIAGIQNQYAEINAKEISDKRKELYDQQQTSQDGKNTIKFFGAKALKNLSNVNIY